jgi:hypothetical protein
MGAMTLARANILPAQANSFARFATPMPKSPEAFNRMRTEVCPSEGAKFSGNKYSELEA